MKPMINIIIIEDERPAREDLIRSLQQLEQINVVAQVTSVKEGIELLSGPVNADIIFSDVQLTDGLSFEIFRNTPVKIPVIFITAYDQFMMNAFEYNGIDYLLKPASDIDLKKALVKYQMLKIHFSPAASIDKLISYVDRRRKKRLLVKRGVENISLLLEDIVLFYTENKIVFVLDRVGKKYIAEKNLAELETELDDELFFRANRQYILNISFIKGFKTYEKVKLQVDLTMPELNHLIIISQETAPAFRRWICEA
jgi:DNA-binding LytR/AlgR family response regulator